MVKNVNGVNDKCRPWTIDEIHDYNLDKYDDKKKRDRYVIKCDAATCSRQYFQKRTIKEHHIKYHYYKKDSLLDIPYFKLSESKEWILENHEVRDTLSKSEKILYINKIVVDHSYYYHYYLYYLYYLFFHSYQ